MAKTKKNQLPDGAPDPQSVEPVGRVTGLPDVPGGNAPIVVKDRLNDGITPQPKVIAGGAAGAITTLIIFGLRQAGIEVPGDVGAAITTLLTFFFAYITPNK